MGSGGTQVRIPWAGSSSCVCFSTKKSDTLEFFWSFVVTDVHNDVLFEVSFLLRSANNT